MNVGDSLLYNALFSQENNYKVKCFLCPHNCIINEGHFGLCSVRTNEKGILKTVNYGEVTAMAVDPIEKKPLYHYKPNKYILSVGSFGCNFTCGFCQNYSIAHSKPKSEYISPEQLIETCRNMKDNIGIAFTYNEPSIWYEYVYETSRKLKEARQDFSIVLITNGYIELEPLLQLLPYVDAMNIDLKAFNQDYYRKICGGDLKVVLRTIETSYKKCHVEITTLLVNGLNDSADEVVNIAQYLSNLDKDIPLHLTRYFPTYKMDRPPTEMDVMIEGWKIAKQHLNYVYLGNVDGVDNSTYCPECGEALIIRNRLTSKILIEKAVCPKCRFDINIVL